MISYSISAVPSSSPVTTIGERAFRRCKERSGVRRRHPKEAERQRVGNNPDGQARRADSRHFRYDPEREGDAVPANIDRRVTLPPKHCWALITGGRHRGLLRWLCRWFLNREGRNGCAGWGAANRCEGHWRFSTSAVGDMTETTEDADRALDGGRRSVAKNGASEVGRDDPTIHDSES